VRILYINENMKAVVKTDSKGRIAIPKTIREKAEIKPGDLVEISLEEVKTLEEIIKKHVEDREISQSEIDEINDIDGDGFVQVKLTSGALTEEEIGGNPLIPDKAKKEALEQGILYIESIFQTIGKLDEKCKGKLPPEALEAVACIANLSTEHRNQKPSSNSLRIYSAMASTQTISKN